MERSHMDNFYFFGINQTINEIIFDSSNTLYLMGQCKKVWIEMRNRWTGHFPLVYSGEKNVDQKCERKPCQHIRWLSRCLLVFACQFIFLRLKYLFNPCDINDHREKWIENRILLDIHMQSIKTAHKTHGKKTWKLCWKKCVWKLSHQAVVPPPLCTWNEI